MPFTANQEPACKLYALELAERLKETGVSTASVHPGAGHAPTLAKAAKFSCE